MDGDTQGSGWLDDQSTDPARADQMLRKSLRLLTGAESDGEAWAPCSGISTARMGAATRATGRASAWHQAQPELRETQAGPHHGTIQHAATDHGAIAATGQAGHVRESDIVVYDASRWVNDSIFLPAHAEFPGIRFEDQDGGEGRFKSSPTSTSRSTSATPARRTTARPTCRPA